MSKLTTKQESYSHFKGISFDQSTFTTSPTITGNRTRNGNAVVMSTPFTRDGQYDPTIVEGPVTGQNAYKFTFNDTSSPQKSSRLYFGSVTSNTLPADDIRRIFYETDANAVMEDILFGLWVKTPASYNSFAQTGVSRLIGATGANTGQNILNITVGANSSIQPIIGINPIGELTGFVSNSTTTFAAEWDKWYFVAIRRSGYQTNSGTAGSTATGNLTYTYYINGQERTTVSVSSWKRCTISAITWGHSSASPINQEWSVSLAGWFATNFGAIGASGLAEIYSTFSDSINNATVLSASAIQTEPTIIVTSSDYTEVTTSFIASTQFPSNISVSASQNINITITQTLDASADVNNAEINTPTSVSFNSDILIASALMTNAIVSENPMNASATMPGGTASVTPNYYSLVKSKNPYIYYYDGGGASTAVNSGYQSGTLTRGAQTLALQDSPNPMQTIGNGKSWRTANTSNADNWFRFNSPNLETSFNQILKTGEYSVEMWINTSNNFSFVSGYGDNFENIGGSIYEAKNIWFDSEGLTFGPYARWNANSTDPVQNSGFYMTVKTGPTTSTTIFGAYNSIIANNWQHIVVRSYTTSGSNRQIELWLNGSVILSTSYTMSSWTPTSTQVQLGTSDDGNSGGIYQSYLDEWALYPTVLENTTIVNHHNFIANFSPYVDFIAPSLSANAEIINSQLLAIDNAILTGNTATATALLVNPSVIIGISKTVTSETFTATALLTTTTQSLGNSKLVSPMIAYSESNNAFRLNQTYFNYVKSNIDPYRYVTFDGNNSYIDYGTDTSYSVAMTVVGGTIVNPDLGINGKSAKTAGTSYVTDGVILKESEWNDSWGTGANDWHSAFWFQRALDDNSTTGLRVLWNLNGYKDNQHAVLYQYQGRLHMQFNNGSGTFIETDSTALDLFDYQRHFIVIDHNHGGGGTNTIKLYVDSVLRFTVNIGSITPTTTNAITADSGANNEANNHPRLSIGCLITPFGSTALPVAPANAKLIIDEVYWDKNTITQNQVTSLYSAMPGQGHLLAYATPLDASATIVGSSISTSVNIIADPMVVLSLLSDITLTVIRVVNVSANLFTATASMGSAYGFEEKNIFADLFIATAIFNSPGVKQTIPGGPMLATVTLPTNIRGVYYPPSYPIASPVTYLFKNIPTIYVRYLMQKSYVNSIPLYKEIK